MTKKCSTKDFDKAFDDGESVIEYLDLDRAVRKVNIDLPEWMIGALDQESERIGISRQALIKTWIADRIDAKAHAKPIGR